MSNHNYNNGGQRREQYARLYIGNNMRKTWRNSRQVIIHQVPAEAECVDRLVALLATSMERLLAEQGKETPELLDFTPGVLPNTCAGKETMRELDKTMLAYDKIGNQFSV